MKKEVFDAVFGARVFYFSFHLLAVIIMIKYDNDLMRDYKDNTIYPIILYAFLMAISIYLFLTCGKNPGYAPVNNERSDSQVSNKF